MCGIYCVYKQSRSCQLPFCASPIFHFEIGDFSVYLYIYIYRTGPRRVRQVGLAHARPNYTAKEFNLSSFSMWT